MSSRQSLETRARRKRGESDWTRRGAACQCTLATCRLGEEGSGRTLRPVGNENADRRRQGNEQRSARRRHWEVQHRIQNRCGRAARRTRAALLLGGLNELCRRRGTILVRLGCRCVMLGCVLSVAAVVGVPRCWPRIRMGSCPTLVVTRAAKRHGRRGSTLRGQRKGQQPDQQRSDEQAHTSNLPQRVLEAIWAAQISPPPIVHYAANVMGLCRRRANAKMTKQ